MNENVTLRDHELLHRINCSDTLQYEHSTQIEKNYHTLCTIPHHYDEHNGLELEADAVELATSSNIKVTQICGLCGHHLCGDSHALECGHEFHTKCMARHRPMNFQCPECETDIDECSTMNGIDDSDDELDSVHGDVAIRTLHVRDPRLRGCHPVEAKLQLL